jgi:3-phenylpropionate/trans-cinnamate dioxygenase ferredoxin subunit
MFYPLERLMNLYDGYQRGFTVEGHSLLLVQDNGRCYLLRNHCPHQQAPLTNATMNNGNLRCSVHGMEFDLLTGKSKDGCSQALQFIPVIYEGSQLGVEV